MWLRGVIGARAFPFALLGAVVCVTGAYGLGRLHGSQSAALDCEQEKAAALEGQIDQDRATARADTATVASVQGKAAGVKSEIDAVPGAAMCASVECLRYFNAAVDIVTAHAGRTD